MDTRYRPVPTRRGTYLVPWTPAALNALVTEERLDSDAFIDRGDGEFKAFIRALFLAGLADEFSNHVKGESRLSRLARELLARRQRRKARRRDAHPAQAPSGQWALQS